MKPPLPHDENIFDQMRLPQNDVAFPVLDALYQAIPDEEARRLDLIPPGTKENGGTVRGTGYGHMYIEQAVASYNNTRRNEQEIVDWFERALVGVHTK